MTVQSYPHTPEAVLQQIDTITDELRTLREIVQELLYSRSTAPRAPDERPSVLDIVEASPGQRIFRNSDDVTRFLREERATWDS